MKIVEADKKQFGKARWRSLPEIKNRSEPSQKVHEDVPQMPHRLLKRKNI